ncbi:uncharacterized protein LOC123877624 [Maniola jurtina]|uniref:uncharacterized protein LOC123877624 n=1 Tax=Maniola jurtina TaxID=191418 RepID=UPI001E68E35B|nr:uncharacterized protein LOC123877624 [Maniola jurtina]
MDEFFIESVRQHPCLWDTKLPHYKNLEVKDAAWKDIAKKTKIESPSAAKTKWKNLRDTHREALKKINKNKRKSGRPHKKIKSWKYMSHMEFLVPHMSQRDTVTPPPDAGSVDDTAGLDHVMDTSMTDMLPVAHKKKKDDIVTDDSEGLCTLLKEIEDSREKLLVQREELRKELLAGDPLKAFFDSMYKSTKQMPEYYQRSIKKELFQLVMHAEDNIANTINQGVKIE